MAGFVLAAWMGLSPLQAYAAAEAVQTEAPKASVSACLTCSQHCCHMTAVPELPLTAFELRWPQVETLRKQPLGPGQQSAATDASPDLPPLPTDFPPLPDIKPAPIDEVRSPAYMWCIQRSLYGNQTAPCQAQSLPCELCLLAALPAF